MCLDIRIQEGALFIADAHDSAKRDYFFNFLTQLLDVPPPQLFLMGDMFDVFIGNVTYTQQRYAHYIELINRLAKRCEIFYFEGNHDFNLSSCFEGVHIIPIQQQPQIAHFEDNTACLLLHGDCYEKGSYALYTAWIRNSITLKVLNVFDKLLGGGISKHMMNSQEKKELCRSIGHFKEIIDAKIGQYPTDNIGLIIEGHYHQDKMFLYENVCYINLASFACTKRYFKVNTAEKTKLVPMEFKP